MIHPAQTVGASDGVSARTVCFGFLLIIIIFLSWQMLAFLPSWFLMLQLPLQSYR